MSTPSDTLRAAAARIREVALAAIPGQWSPRDGWGPSPQVYGPPLMNVRRIANDSHDTVLEASNTGRDIVATHATFDHIVLWSPPVAATVATWLEATADLYEPIWRGPNIPVELGLALATANAILGEAS